jgi:hypothetical protein
VIEPSATNLTRCCYNGQKPGPLENKILSCVCPAMPGSDGWFPQQKLSLLCYGAKMGSFCTRAQQAHGERSAIATAPPDWSNAIGSLRRTPSGRSNFSSPRQHALNPMSQKPQAVYPCGVGPGSATDFGGEKVNCLSADRAAIRQNQENPAARIGTAGPSPRIGRSFTV